MESSSRSGRALPESRPGRVLTVAEKDEESTRGARGVELFSRPRRRRQVIAATRHITTLLRAGFTLDRALASAAALSGAGPVIKDVQERVRGGSTLAAALGAHPGYFGEFYRGMVAAGERSGELSRAFDRLADHLETQAELRSRVLSSLLYPGIMVLAGSAAVILLLLFVIPRFVTILGDVGGTLPWSARTLVVVSQIVTGGWWIMAAVVAVATAAIIWHRRTPAGRLAQDRWLLRLPLFGPLRARLATERVARSLAGALSGGIPLLESLDIAADSAADAAFRADLHAAGESVRRGESLSAAFRRGGVFPELAVQMIGAGEESGRLVAMLQHVSEVFQRETERHLRTLTSLVEPAVILVFGAAVAFVALALLQTIYGIGTTF